MSNSSSRSSGRVSMVGEEGLVVVTLDHIDKYNAMSCDMWRSLRDVFRSIQNSKEWRCVLLHGQGRQFCAGGDISEYPGFRFEEAQLRAFHEEDVWGGLEAMLSCDVPIVAAIDGHCMGAGVEMACCCDIRIASRSARFGAPIARLGFPMAPRETQLVMQVAGETSTREMLLEAAVLDAPEMKARGFLHAIVDEHELMSYAGERARRIASLAPEAARMNKQTLRALGGIRSGSNPGEGLDGILPSAYNYASSAEHREGIAAFLGKRAPKFY